MEKLQTLRTAESERASHIDYFKIAISTDCVIFGYDKKELKVLLIKSDFKEFSGLWSLLGDLVQPGEELESASYRVLKEKTGLDDVYLEQVYTFGSLNRHPSGRVITTAYYSLVEINHCQLKLTHNELHWHKLADIKELAFDHKVILDTCIARLREQIMEKPLIFNLLPEKFSLRQLQELHEAILDVKLDRRNFRKKMSLKDWLIDLGEMENDVQHRPGKLYKAKVDYRRNKKRKIDIKPTYTF